MKRERTQVLYQNAWCKIISKGTIYILQSKPGKYNDQYFFTLQQALNKIGLTSIPTK